MSDPFISICIPAYKRVEYLKRLLDSIAIQQFRDFEVIVTDDSPSDEVRLLCNQYTSLLPLQYHKNESVKGTPENWNEAIRHAKGEWIKLMHDDDWFTDPDSLAEFVKAAKQHTGRSFIFSGYQNVYEDHNKTEIVRISSFRKKKLEQDAVTLFSSNVIGPPSVTLVKNDQTRWYDRRMIWLVDIDFYIHYLRDAKPVYIDRSLVNVGIHKDQVTRKAFRKPWVEVPEGFLLLQKTGAHHLRNIIVYDAWWRLLRNLAIDSVEKLKSYQQGEWPPIIFSMLKDVNRVPKNLIRKGVISKFLMTLSYLRNRRKIQ